MAAPHYRFLSVFPSYAANGDRVCAELPLEQVKWSRVISGAGGFTAKLNQRHALATIENLRAGYHQIVVERNGVVKWAGLLWTVQTSLVRTDPYLTLGALETWSYFTSIGDTTRALEDDPPFEWDTMDQVEVAADCITLAQTYAPGTAPNADMGVQIGTIVDTGITRDMGGLTPPVGFGEIITGMAEKDDGFDFTIEPSWDADAFPVLKLKKVFNTYFPMKLDVSFAGLNAGMPITNAVGTFDATRMGTHAIANGSDITSVADAFTDYWRRDLVRTLSDITDQGVLDNQALAAVGRYGRPVSLPSISVVNSGDTPLDLLNDFSLGDLIAVDLDEGYLKVQADLRISSYDVEWNAGTEIVTFNLNYLADSI